MAQVQVLHDVLQSGIRWRVTLHACSDQGCLVRFEKSGKGGRLLHQESVQWNRLAGGFLLPSERVAGGMVPEYLVQRIEAILRGSPLPLGASSGSRCGGGWARGDSDADIPVVMPFEGRPQDTVKGMRNACQPAFPLDLHLRRLDEIAPRYRWGDPFIREALIAQGVDSCQCRDLQILSDKLRVPIPGWRPNPETLNTLTLGAIAYLQPCEGHPEPSQDGAWAIAQAGPLRACLRGWFDSLSFTAALQHGLNHGGGDADHRRRARQPDAEGCRNNAAGAFVELLQGVEIGVGFGGR